MFSCLENITFELRAGFEGLFSLFCIFTQYSVHFDKFPFSRVFFGGIMEF